MRSSSKSDMIWGCSKWLPYIPPNFAVASSDILGPLTTRRFKPRCQVSHERDQPILTKSVFPIMKAHFLWIDEGWLSCSGYKRDQARRNRISFSNKDSDDGYDFVFWHLRNWSRGKVLNPDIGVQFVRSLQNTWARFGCGRLSSIYQLQHSRRGDGQVHCYISSSLMIVLTYTVRYH